MDIYNKNRIISIVVSSFGIPSKNISIIEDDIYFLDAFFSKQKIFPLLVVGLKNMGCSDLLTEDLKKKEAKSIYDYVQLKSSLNIIGSAFEIAAIPYIPLKGSFIRDLYPEPWMRTSSDIDVLVKSEYLDSAINVLKNQTEFRFVSKAQHDVHLISNHVHLELHYSLSSALDSFDFILLDPWHYSIQYNESYRYIFTNEFNLAYIILHAAKHLIRNGGIGIRPLLDIYVLRTNSKYDEQIVKELCVKTGVLTFYNTCCKLLDIWFNGSEYDDITSDFEELVFSGGVFGSKQLEIISNKRINSGKNYTKQRFFKSSEELKIMFPNCKKHPVLVPFYQIIRWTHIFKKNKFKEYVNENKQAYSINSAELDKYDRLMKNLGF